jgi:hypothetical protein
MTRPDAITPTALDPARLAMVRGRPITCRVLGAGYREAGDHATANIYAALAEEAERAQTEEKNHAE